MSVLNQRIWKAENHLICGEIARDVGQFSDAAAAFNNRRQLASYVGYAPSPFQSGNVAHDQGISKAGNRKGRTTGIELAWLWLRYQPDSDLSVWFRARVGTVKGRIRRIAIVALARKLLVALWRYLETGLVPRGAVLKG